MKNKNNQNEQQWQLLVLLLKEIERIKASKDSRLRLKEIAIKNGFKSIAELERQNKEIDLYNECLLSEIHMRAVSIFENEGVMYEGWKVSHMVKLDGIKTSIYRDFPEFKKHFN